MKYKIVTSGLCKGSELAEKIINAKVSALAQEGYELKDFKVNTVENFSGAEHEIYCNSRVEKCVIPRSYVEVVYTAVMVKYEVENVAENVEEE